MADVIDEESSSEPRNQQFDFDIKADDKEVRLIKKTKLNKTGKSGVALILPGLIKAQLKLDTIGDVELTLVLPKNSDDKYLIIRPVKQ
jgi:hypothetical protein